MTPNTTADANASFSILEQPLHTPRKLRVVCIGAGFSGLTLIHKLKHELHMDEYIDLTVYEKNHDVGGTWLENRYPGVACDAPAHIYTFLFEPNPNWNAFYAPGQEIQSYIRATTTKYGLDEKIQFNSTVTSAHWNPVSGTWSIKVSQPNNTIIEDDNIDILINATGFLNKWRWPDIPNLHSFQGSLTHSASWDLDLSWAGKRVAIIGNGASGVQILPAMQRDAGEVVTYIRSPTWISGNFGAEFAGPDGKNFTYSEADKARFRENPETLRALRKEMGHYANGIFGILLKESPLQKTFHDTLTQSMKERLGDREELHEKLIPDWGVGCRRLTPGDGYLEALTQENVSIDMNEIEEVTSSGITTKAGHREIDIIVCATGFDVRFIPSWEMVGKDGIELSQQWKDIPEAYLGICAPNMPNYFFFHGPNSPVGNGSITGAMDWTAEYILRWCRKIAQDDIKSVCVRSDATIEYNAYIEEFMKRTIWTSGCRSWYKNGKVDGKVTALYAGSSLHFKEMLESFRTEDFEFEYRSRNRFRFMGNGFTNIDVDGGDRAFYIKK